MEFKVPAYSCILVWVIFVLSAAHADSNKSPLKVCKKSNKLYLSSDCKGNYLTPKSLEELSAKNCEDVSLSTLSVSGPTGQSGPQGEKGDKGNSGDTGKALFDQLPEGVTISGYTGDKVVSFLPSTATNFYQTSVTFPYKASKEITSENIELINAASGNFENPGSPKGKLSVYILYMQNAEDITVIPLGKIGFALKWRVPFGGYTEVRAAWAYQAGGVVNE